jgi:hypothetical protein
MLLPIALFASLAIASHIPYYKGPEIWGSYNTIDDDEMQQAIECLTDQVCARRRVPYHGKIRCTIGTSVAYLCNYLGHKDRGDGADDHKDNYNDKDDNHHFGELECSDCDMYEAWRQIRIAQASQTGWWYSSASKRTYGFDRRCANNECDNGWKIGSEGEQCTNIDKSVKTWLFDFESATYPNYTGKYKRSLPTPGDASEPVYFNPWQQGKRPT